MMHFYTITYSSMHLLFLQGILSPSSVCFPMVNEMMWDLLVILPWVDLTVATRRAALQAGEIQSHFLSQHSFSLCLQPSISGVDLDKFRQILLNHCDVNKDGKIQKSELALCLGLKINP